MRGIRAIIFDKDGTLFGFQATWSAWAVSLLAELAGEDEALAEAIAARLDFDRAARAFRPDSIVIADTPDAIAAAILPLLPGRPAPADLVSRVNRIAAATAMVPAIELPPFFDGLKARGLAIGLATNDAEAPARQHLDRAGIADRFDFIAGFDSGHGAKPGPGQILAFAAHVGADPAEIAMVGDSTHDLVAAGRAGVARIAVLTGMAGADVLAPHADVILPDIGHIPDWLDRRI